MHVLCTLMDCFVDSSLFEILQQANLDEEKN